MSLIESITDKLRRRNQQRWETFDALVKATADGETIDPDDAADVLEATGKTPDELDAAVELLRKRREWRATLDLREELQQKLAELENERTEANERLAAVRQAHREALERIREADLAIRGQLAACEGAEASLQSTYNAEPVIQRLDEIKNETAPLRAELRRLQETCGRWDAQHRDAQRRLDELRRVNQHLGSEGRQVSGMMDEANRIVRSHEPRIAELREKLESLEREQRQLAAAHLVP